MIPGFKIEKYNIKTVIFLASLFKFLFLRGYKNILLTKYNTLLLCDFHHTKGKTMKLKSLLFVVCLGLFSNLFAANEHVHPKADAADRKTISKSTMYPGYCQIELINDSFTDVYVYGTFDDGTTVNFSIYRYEAPHYINLFYYFYCHTGMYLTVQSPYGVVYSGWTNVDSTVHIVPFFAKGAKAEITAR